MAKSLQSEAQTTVILMMLTFGLNFTSDTFPSADTDVFLERFFPFALVGVEALALLWPVRGFMDSWEGEPKPRIRLFMSEKRSNSFRTRVLTEFGREESISIDFTNFCSCSLFITSRDE